MAVDEDAGQTGGEAGAELMIATTAESSPKPDGDKPFSPAKTPPGLTSDHNAMVVDKDEGQRGDKAGAQLMTMGENSPDSDAIAYDQIISINKRFPAATTLPDVTQDAMVVDKDDGEKGKDVNDRHRNEMKNARLLKLAWNLDEDAHLSSRGCSEPSTPSQPEAPDGLEATRLLNGSKVLYSSGSVLTNVGLEANTVESAISQLYTQGVPISGGPDDPASSPLPGINKHRKSTPPPPPALDIEPKEL
jgi:hypothetical protein